MDCRLEIFGRLLAEEIYELEKKDYCPFRLNILLVMRLFLTIDLVDALPYQAIPIFLFSFYDTNICATKFLESFFRS